MHWWLSIAHVAALTTTLAAATLAACSDTDSDPGTGQFGGQIAIPEVAADDPGPALSTDCRPVDQRWKEGDPLRLPCEPTVEPCDGEDNDADGITDPHCPSVPCQSDADCTYGGLIPDADCDFHALGRPGCNQIDGSEEAAILCQGMLCPPGLKCTSGRCVSPGRQMPGTPCVTGADCPINSGCIPSAGWQHFASATCSTFCHDFPCPQGTVCVPERWTLDGQEFRTATCQMAYGCREALYACEAPLVACTDSTTCALGACVLEHCDEFDDAACVRSCAETARTDALSDALAECLLSACPEP